MKESFGQGSPQWKHAVATRLEGGRPEGGAACALDKNSVTSFDGEAPKRPDSVVRRHYCFT